MENIFYWRRTSYVGKHRYQRPYRVCKDAGRKAFQLLEREYVPRADGRHRRQLRKGMRGRNGLGREPEEHSLPRSAATARCPSAPSSGSSASSHGTPPSAWKPSSASTPIAISCTMAKTTRKASAPSSKSASRIITPSLRFCHRQNHLCRHFNEAGDMLAACYLRLAPTYRGGGHHSLVTKARRRI